MLSERGKKIIAHTIAMSKDIGLDMVAEGVETKEQASFLSQCGCDTVQGFCIQSLSLWLNLRKWLTERKFPERILLI